MFYESELDLYVECCCPDDCITVCASYQRPLDHSDPGYGNISIVGHAESTSGQDASKFETFCLPQDSIIYLDVGLNSLGTRESAQVLVSAGMSEFSWYGHRVYICDYEPCEDAPQQCQYAIDILDSPCDASGAFIGTQVPSPTCYNIDIDGGVAFAPNLSTNGIYDFSFIKKDGTSTSISIGYTDEFDLLNSLEIWLEAELGGIWNNISTVNSGPGEISLIDFLGQGVSGSTDGLGPITGVLDEFEVVAVTNGNLTVTFTTFFAEVLGPCSGTSFAPNARAEEFVVEFLTGQSFPFRVVEGNTCRFEHSKRIIDSDGFYADMDVYVQFGPSEITGRLDITFEDGPTLFCNYSSSGCGPLYQIRRRYTLSRTTFSANDIIDFSGSSLQYFGGDGVFGGCGL